jgi:hypothetical protein
MMLGSVPSVEMRWCCKVSKKGRPKESVPWKRTVTLDAVARHASGRSLERSLLGHRRCSPRDELSFALLERPIRVAVEDGRGVRENDADGRS